MTKQACATCRFWRATSWKLEDDTATGECRRNPPRIVDEIARIDTRPEPTEIDHPTIFAATRFPLLAAFGWCGKWREAPSPEDAAEQGLGPWNA